AVPMILLATTLMRYARWEATNYGNWLAGFADPRYGYDPYLDLLPPVLANGLYRRFEHWWQSKWTDLHAFVLARYVVEQHCSMSEEGRTGNGCLLPETGSKVFATGEYEKIGMDNHRLSSAIQILKDLGLMEDGSTEVTYLTKEGKRFLKQEMKK